MDTLSEYLLTNYLIGVHSAGSQGSACNNEPNNTPEDESSALTFGSLPSADGSDDDDDDESLNVVAKKFVYKITGENHLTGKAVQSIALATRHVIHGLLRTLKKKVKDVLHNADTVDEEIQTVGNLFDEAAEEMEILQTPLSETFSIRDDHTGLDNIVSNPPKCGKCRLCIMYFHYCRLLMFFLCKLKIFNLYKCSYNNTLYCCLP